MSAINFFQLKRKMSEAENGARRLEILSEFLDVHEEFFVLSPQTICSILQIFNDHAERAFCLAALQTCLPYTIPPFTFTNLAKVCKMFHSGQNISWAVTNILSIFRMERIAAAQICAIAGAVDSDFDKFIIIESFVCVVAEISNKDLLPQIMRSDDMKREVRALLEVAPERRVVPDDVPRIDIIDLDAEQLEDPAPQDFYPPAFVPDEQAPPPPPPAAAQLPLAGQAAPLPRRKFSLLELEGNAETTANENEQCILCCDNKKTVVFLPCLHLCCCVECARQLNRRACPYCRQRIARAYNSKPVE